MVFQSTGLGGCVRRASIIALMGTLSACGGGGGGGPSVSPSPTPTPTPTPTDVTISGKITFDRIPFDTTMGTGLNPNAPVESPARGVVVEAISGAATLASTVTDAAGNYSVTVPANTQVNIRAKAQMLKADAAPTWNFRVLNNTNSDALYVLDGSTTSSGTANSTRNLRASSGWTGTSYGATRAAAPFAILDTVYAAKELVTSASASAIFPALDLHWSGENRATNNLCPDDGQVGTFFTDGGSPDQTCPAQTVNPGIYLVGNTNTGDTDEFDQHVIAHEFGHYLEAKFSRSDSLGGDHGPGNRLDLRLAFSEGFGNAFSGMVLNDPVYRDSQSVAASDFGFNMEQDVASVEGWFSEASVHEILWDVFDPANEANDAVALGFGPIFSVLTTSQRTTSAFVSIFSFLSQLRAAVPNSGSDIDLLRTGELIFGTTDFGAGESNNGGDVLIGNDLGALPVYRPIAIGQQPIMCVKRTNGIDNKLGNRRFFQLEIVNGATVTFTAIGAVDPANPASAAALDPDIFVFRRGSTIASGFVETTSTQTISNVPLIPGTYIIDVYDASTNATGTRCMTFSVTGTGS